MVGEGKVEGEKECCQGGEPERSGAELPATSRAKTYPPVRSGLQVATGRKKEITCMM